MNEDCELKVGLLKKQLQDVWTSMLSDLSGALPFFYFLLCFFYVHLPQILDFGLARHTDDEMTGYVATRWYRAPEIMLNWMHYNMTGTHTQVDIIRLYVAHRTEFLCSELFLDLKRKKI